ncbi:hypothetical protein [Anoxynatronum buryatiense]|uniref:Uncharacterized protein n=1 Tax=Anoxynatronum buryatiense TaxID=489973 RepID=A0AA45WXD1_9CLOT|nr:hypothetical protein [Anoxynatronum buryatiense]SMP61873.1 hypothetical protein SAMN06296020_109113 [Anoxynatronum buryatiense]
MKCNRVKRLSVGMLITTVSMMLTMNPVSAATDSTSEAAGWLSDLIIACVNLFVRLVMIFVG